MVADWLSSAMVPAGSALDWAWSSRPVRVSGGMQSIGVEVPMPRRSSATSGRDVSSAPGGPAARPASVTVEGRSEPDVNTNGGASSGVSGSRARIAPAVNVP